MATDPPTEPLLPYARYEADNVARRSRLTTFFRFFLVLPHLVILFFWGIVMYVTLVLAWFAILITGRYPAGLFAVNAGFARYSARVTAYWYLLAERWPAVSGGAEPEYETRLVVTRQPTYGRLSVLFRIVLLIPVALVNYVLSIGAGLLAFVAWFVVLVLGRMPDGLFVALAFCLSYSARSNAYALLVTDGFPWFRTEEHAVGVSAGTVLG